MSKVYEIAFQMGGQLTGAFSKTMRGANAALGDLQNNIKQLNSQSADISSLQKMQRSLGSLSREYNEAQEKAQQLAQELRETENPTKKQQQEFDRARKSASRLKQELAEQRGELHRLRTSMGAAGESTRELIKRQKELAAASEHARKMQAKLQKTMAAQEANLGRREELRGQMLDAAGLAVAMAAPIKLAADWEQQLAELNKVANATPSELKGISQSAQELAVQTGVAREEIIGAYTAAAQAGFARNEWAKFAETSAKMGVAFDTTGEQAGEMLKAWRSGMALTMEDATKLAGAANHLANNMNATAMGIGNVLQRQGAVFKTAGVDQTTGAALAASLLSSGASDEIAATAGKNFVLALTQGAAATSTQKDVLAMLGFSDPQALAKQMQEAPQQAIMQVLESIRSLDADQQTAAISQLFGKESIGGIAPLIGNLENLANAFELVGSEAKYANSLEEEFNALQSTTNQQAKKAWESVKALGTAFGAVLLPPINSLLQAIAPLAMSLANLAQEFPFLTKLVVGSIAGLIALKVASIGVGYAWTFVKGGALQLQKVMQTMRIVWLLNTGAVIDYNKKTAAAIKINKAMAMSGAAVSKAFTMTGLSTLASTVLPMLTAGFSAVGAAIMATPIGWIAAAVAGVVAAAVLVYKYWKPIKAFFSGMLDGIQQGFSTAFASVAQSFQPVLEAFSFLTPVVRLVSNMFGWLWAQVKKVVGWLGSLFEQAEYSQQSLNGITESGRKVGSVISSVFKVILLPIKLVGWAIGGIVKAFKSVWAWLSSFSLVGAINKIVDGVKWAFMNLTPMGWIIKAFIAAKNWLSQFSLKGVATSLINGVKTAFSYLNPINWIMLAFNKAKSWLSNFSLFNSGRKILQTLGSGIMSAANSVIDSVKGVFSRVREYLPFSDAKVGPFSELTKSGAAIMNTLASGVEQTPNLQQAVSSQFQETTQAELPSTSNKRSRLLDRAIQTTSNDNSSALSVTLTQNITVTGEGGADVRQQAADGAREGVSNLREQLEQLMTNKRRLSYG